MLASELASLEASALGSAGLQASALKASDGQASSIDASSVGAPRVASVSVEPASVKASIPEASIPRASIREASISERSISQGVIPESSISEGSVPRAGEALPPAALDGVTDGVTALARPAPLPDCEPRRVSFDLGAPSAARPLPLSNLTNLTNTNPTSPTINLSKMTNPTNRANPTNGRRPMFATPPPSHAPPFVIYQGEGGEGGGDEGGGRDASPHTDEQPVASAAHGAMPAMTPPLQFWYARRAMALALGPAHVPGKLDGVVAAAAM